MLFVLSAAHAVTAISLVGLAVATGVWCGTAVVVSFAYGMLVAGDQVEHLGQAVAAISLTLAGIAGIAVASWIGGGGDGAAGEDAERGLGSSGCGGHLCCIQGCMAWSARGATTTNNSPNPTSSPTMQSAVILRPACCWVQAKPPQQRTAAAPTLQSPGRSGCSHAAERCWACWQR